MSASLVGSEMCIRDRPRTHMCGSEAQRGIAGRARGRAGSSRAGHSRRGCLLYTSDAADDM
eukprot:11096068-Alexandrium_andersonii.AAC.1